MGKLLHILSAEVCGPYSLLVSFSDGVVKQVNLRPLIWGPAFEPLLDPAYFAKVTVDPRFHTVVWPNDVDLAPEALYDLPDERDDAA